MLQFPTNISISEAEEERAVAFSYSSMGQSELFPDDWAGDPTPFLPNENFWLYAR